MTMTFSAADPMILNGVRVGDAVTFEVKSTTENHVVTRVQSNSLNDRRPCSGLQHGRRSELSVARKLTSSDVPFSECEMRAVEFAEARTAEVRDLVFDAPRFRLKILFGFYLC